MVHRMFTVLKEGGLSSDRDGQVKATGLNRLVKSLKDENNKFRNYT